MSVHLMSRVWDDDYYQQGDKAKLLVALALADYANKDGVSWPSIEALSHKSRSSIRSVQEMLRILEKDGKVVIEIGRGPNKTNRYLLCKTPQPLHPATIAPRKMTPEKPAEILAESLASDCTQTVRNRQEPSGTVKNYQGKASEIFDAWNEMGEPFPEIQAITEKRTKAIKARLSDKFFASHWREAIDRLKASDFAKGSGSSGWIATIDFFLQPDSVAKIMEGKYDNHSSRPNRPNGKRLPYDHGFTQPQGDVKIIQTVYDPIVPRQLTETDETDEMQESDDESSQVPF